MPFIKWPQPHIWPGGRVLAPYKEQQPSVLMKKIFCTDSRTKTIEIHSSDLDLEFTVNEKVFYVNGERQMDVAPACRDGQIFLPVKWIAGALGYAVAWEAKSLSILLGPPGNCHCGSFTATVLNVNVRICELSGDSLYAVNKLSSSSIVFVGEYANVFNAGVAARYADGFILAPNKIFSFDDVVGERTAEGLHYRVRYFG